jgi:hypothetical protein
MFNISRAFLDNTFNSEYLKYCFDRSSTNEAKGAEGNAAGVAATEQGNANNANAMLTPFYRSEMNAQHLFTPQQQNEMLGAGEAGISGANATGIGEANSEAARTRNTSGFSAALDQNARNRMSATGALGQNVAAQDVMGAKQLNQQGAAGMAGLYGQDTDAMLKAMGIQNQDINTQLEAGKSGWFQNLTSGLSALSPGYSKKGGLTFGG